MTCRPWSATRTCPSTRRRCSSAGSSPADGPLLHPWQSGELLMRPLSVLLALVIVPAALGQQPRALPENVQREADITYGKAGDVPLKLDLYLPKAEAKKPRPVV